MLYYSLNMQIHIDDQHQGDRTGGSRHEIEVAVLMWLLIAGIFALLANVIAATFIQ